MWINLFYKLCLPDNVPEFAYGENRYPHTQLDYDDDTNTGTLVVELPGVKKENLEVKTSDQMIKVQTKSNDETKNNNQFRRIFTFRYKIKAESVKANLSDGILTLTYNKDLPSSYDISIE